MDTLNQLTPKRHKVNRTMHGKPMIGMFDRTLVYASLVAGLFVFAYAAGPMQMGLLFGILLSLVFILAVLALAFLGRNDDRYFRLLAHRLRYRLKDRYDPWKCDRFNAVVTQGRNR